MIGRGKEEEESECPFNFFLLSLSRRSICRQIPGCSYVESSFPATGRTDGRTGELLSKIGTARPGRPDLGLGLGKTPERVVRIFLGVDFHTPLTRSRWLVGLAAVSR